MENVETKTLKASLRDYFEERKGRLKTLGKIALASLVMFVIVSAAISFITQRYTFGVFITNSIFTKTYVLLDKEHSLENLRDKIIAFDFPVDTKYYKKGTPFAKYVKCESGDFLESVGNRFFCNKKLVGVALPTDSKGIPTEHFSFKGVIPKDTFFVMGENLFSFDSRYWGFVTKENIKGVAIWSF